MKKEILEKLAEIESIEHKLDRAAKYYSWIVGIVIGLLISYIIYTL